MAYAVSASAITEVDRADTWTARRFALWGILIAKLVGGWGVGWDIRWHLLIGRDSFWIPPHVMTYSAVTVIVTLSLAILARETLAARSHRAPSDTVTIAGLTGTRGFHLAWWGIALTILAAPIDGLWHWLFGLDVTLWSPPHLLGLAGSQINTLACLLIALEVFPRSSRSQLAVLLIGGTFVLGAFQIGVAPSLRVAFLNGPRWFFTYAVLAAPLFAFTLVLTARLVRWRSAPVWLALGALTVQSSIIAVADVGFALTQPTSSIEAVIATDPAGPIAVAHEMARRNGERLGHSVALHLVPLLPTALMAAVDPRRRWGPASLTFGATLLLVSDVILAKAPALSHALPAMADVLWSLVLTMAGALAGGWVARRLADSVLIVPAAMDPERVAAALASR